MCRIGVDYGKGYVRIKAYTQSPERFLNLCAYHKITVWNLINKNDIYEMNLSINDFFRLKNICKKTGTKIRITGKYGLPFFFYRNKKRKAFFIGILLSFLILFFLFRLYLGIFMWRAIYITALRVF